MPSVGRPIGLLDEALGDATLVEIRDYLQQQRAIGHDAFRAMFEAKTRRPAGPDCHARPYPRSEPDHVLPTAFECSQCPMPRDHVLRTRGLGFSPIAPSPKKSQQPVEGGSMRAKLVNPWDADLVELLRDSKAQGPAHTHREGYPSRSGFPLTSHSSYTMLAKGYAQDKRFLTPV